VYPTCAAIVGKVKCFANINNPSNIQKMPRQDLIVSSSSH